MSKKYVRPFTPAWRWFIGLSSVGAFLGGWAVLVHVPNPYASAETLETPALQEPVPAIQAPTAAPGTSQVPLQSARRTRGQRRFQQFPSQGFGTLPETRDEDADDGDSFTLPSIQPQVPNSQVQPSQQTQPNMQLQLPTTRTRMRLRTGGS